MQGMATVRRGMNAGHGHSEARHECRAWPLNRPPICCCPSLAANAFVRRLAIMGAVAPRRA
eukprot:187647-Chlamydomonas_euryale.AAC.4